MEMAMNGDPTCRHGVPSAYCGMCRSLSVPAAGPFPEVRGCICPPGANLTCEAPLCPRRNVFAVGTFRVGNG